MLTYFEFCQTACLQTHSRKHSTFLRKKFTILWRILCIFIAFSSCLNSLQASVFVMKNNILNSILREKPHFFPEVP